MRIVRRVAMGLTLAPLLAAGPARAEILPGILEPIVRGCYGVEVTVCHPHVSSDPVRTRSEPVEVCAVTCRDVNVPMPYLDGSPLCVAFHDSDGNETEECIATRLDR